MKQKPIVKLIRDTLNIHENDFYALEEVTVNDEFVRYYLIRCVEEPFMVLDIEEALKHQRGEYLVLPSEKIRALVLANMRVHNAPYQQKMRFKIFQISIFGRNFLISWFSFTLLR